MASTIAADTLYRQISINFIQEILQDIHPVNFAIRLWDGTMIDPDPGCHAEFTIVLNHPGALRKMFLPANELTLGEAFIFEDFDIEGNIHAVFRLGDYIIDSGMSLTKKLRQATRLLRLPSDTKPETADWQPFQTTGLQHSRQRDRRAVQYHYDISNEFYKLWLGERMVYTCAYFASPDEDLSTAQLRKLDYVCRKLELKEGETFLDVGSGWGGLVIHAAKYYGVKAVGVTISEAQADWARRFIKEEGLEKSCRIEICDYRDMQGQYDKIATLGMYDHVGAKNLPFYYRKMWDVLKPGGRLFQDGSSSNVKNVPRRASFVGSYILPDGELVSFGNLLQMAEETGFEVRDVENLREHYALTLKWWADGIMAHKEEAHKYVDPVTYRIWLLHHAGAAYGFASGRTNNHHSILVKPDRGISNMPLHRDVWYRGELRTTR